jgi:hypothetical protein
LILSLLVLRYVDEAALPDWLKGVVRYTTPLAAILLPTAYFLSVLRPTATEPNGLIALAFVGAAALAAGLLVLGVGLLRRPRERGGASPGERAAITRVRDRAEGSPPVDGVC